MAGILVALILVSLFYINRFNTRNQKSQLNLSSYWETGSPYDDLSEMTCKINRNNQMGGD